MKGWRLAVQSAIPVLLLASGANAAFVGLDLENKTSTYLSSEPDGKGFSVKNAAILELYAVFNDPNDNLLNVFHASIQASNDFYHQPDSTGSISSLPWTKAVYDANGSNVDSFVTLGFGYSGTEGNPDGPDAGSAPDPLQVGLDPQFDEDAFLYGSTIDDPAGAAGKGAGWYTLNASAANIQGKAGTYPGMKVLIGRFSFAPGCVTYTSLSGKLRLTYKNGATTTQTGFFSFSGIGGWSCPAPSAVALLVALPMARSRRRRSA